MQAGESAAHAASAESVSEGGDRNGNAVYFSSSSTRRIAAPLETGARQEPTRPLDGYGHLAAPSEFCGKRAKHSQPGFSFHRIRCLEHSSPRTERSAARVGIRPSVQRAPVSGQSVLPTFGIGSELPARSAAPYAPVIMSRMVG